MIEFLRNIFLALVVVGLLSLAACKQEINLQETTFASQSQISQKRMSNSVSQVENSKKSEMTGEGAASKENATIMPSPESVDIQKLAVGFKEGMPYGDLRKRVISGNWKPKAHRQCKKNVVGDDFESICSKDPQQCIVCDELPELNVCSGDGHCITEFSSNDGRKVLKVSTYGQIQDGLVEGEKSRLFVSWWNISSSGN